MDLLEAKQIGEANIISNRHPWENARLIFLKKLISKYILLSQKSVVIDIGCGDTFVIENLAKEYPCSLFYGVDIAFTDNILKKYRRNLTIKNVFLFQSLDDIPQQTDVKISLVILADVIEHIKDDREFVSGLLKKTLFNSNTFFLITVPAFQVLFCSHDIFLGHYRRYTNAILKKNLTEAGLNVFQTGYFFFLLLPLRMFQVLKEKFGGIEEKNMSSGLVSWNKGGLISEIFLKLLVADMEFSFFLKKAGINLPGLSNYTICKKRV